MRVIASAQAVEYVRERGGDLFVWIERLRYQGAASFLEASTESPGPERGFRRMDGKDFNLFLDVGDHELPDSIEIELRGWRKKHLRAYWNGASFASHRRPGNEESA